METIRIYLENMFQALPKTKEVLDVKDELLGHMTDKYNELKAEGKSENEAVGIVISEFGNIDELMEEMNIHPEIKTEETENLPVVDLEEAREFIRVKKRSGKFVGGGVLLILVGVAIMLLISTAGEFRFGEGMVGGALGTLGVCVLLVFIAAAVGLFIYAGSTEEKFRYLEAPFRVSAEASSEVNTLYQSFYPMYTITVAIGVCLIIISVIPLIASGVLADFTGFGDFISMICLTFLLCMVGVSVFLFIYFGNQKEAFDRLRQIGEYKPENLKEDKLISAVSAIVWPITVVCFLIWGFFYHGWGIAWIVFPVVGILFGAFSALVRIIRSAK